MEIKLQVFSSWILPQWRNTSLEQILVIFLQTADEKSSSENQLKVVKQPFLNLLIFFEDKGIKLFINSQISFAHNNILIEETKLPRKHSLCTDVPLPQKKIGRRDVCESPSLIVFWCTFA